MTFLSSLLNCVLLVATRFPLKYLTLVVLRFVCSGNNFKQVARLKKENKKAFHCKLLSQWVCSWFFPSRLKFPFFQRGRWEISTQSREAAELPFWSTWDKTVLRWKEWRMNTLRECRLLSFRINTSMNVTQFIDHHQFTAANDYSISEATKKEAKLISFRLFSHRSIPFELTNWVNLSIIFDLFGVLCVQTIGDYRKLCSRARIKKVFGISAPCIRLLACRSN